VEEGAGDHASLRWRVRIVNRYQEMLESGEPIRFCKQCRMGTVSRYGGRCGRCKEANILAQLEERERRALERSNPIRHLATVNGADRAFAERWWGKLEHRQHLKDLAASRGISARCAKYGITIGDWMVRVARQDSTCAICQNERAPLVLHIDHDHYDLTVRGLLCSGCNTGLGALGIDGPDAASRANAVLRYLRNVAKP
jgi:hypothetical protein